VLNRRTIICIAALLSLLPLLSGCDDSRRYKVLSYFFDGVPLPESERAALQEQAHLSDPNSVDVVLLQGQPIEIWYTHEPYKSCDVKCHGVRTGGYSGSVRMAVEPPQLCLQCHENMDYSMSRPGLSVHGPVAVGECLMCHSPHKSKYKHVLKQSVPDLCYQCHVASRIELIKGHSQAKDCLKCHYGHTSPEKFLLREGRSQDSR
jgi:predicted CXXCH cytochrome family protein